MAVAGVVVEVALARPGILAQLLRRGADLSGEVAGQTLTAGVDLGPDIGVQAQLLLDALATDLGDVVHPPGPDGAEPQAPALPVADDDGLLSVLSLLA